MSVARRRFKAKPHLLTKYFTYILNIVKHIQDYYASILGEFELVVLLTLLRLGNGTWGAAIRRDIQERTTRELPVSVVYVTLQRLEKKGMVKSYVGNPSAERGGRRRRHYLIDAPGEHALGRSFRAFRTLTQGLEQRLESL
jgi:DNA-binding PadR family transcriptional regulator